MIAQLSEELVWSQIVARAWCDEGFMKRLLSDPRAVLAEHDLEVPPGTEVRLSSEHDAYRWVDLDTATNLIKPERVAAQLSRAAGAVGS